MKNRSNSILMRLIPIACCAIVLLLISVVPSMAFGRYTPGALGLNAATLPPPGFHYTIYNIFYRADTLKDDGRNDVNVGLDLNVFASAHQFTYMTNYKLLGADFGFDMIIPVVNTNIKIEAAGIDESTFGFGDLYFEPFVLGWHKPRWDGTFALGFYAPTAKSGKPSSPGKAHWSYMATLGGTYYLDEGRSWSLSLLSRWLENSKDDDYKITPGANVVAEYGIAKALPVRDNLLFTAGLAGYSYAQLSKDSGPLAEDDRYSAHALGPEIRLMTFRPFPIQVSLRYLFEYAAKNTTQGHNMCLTLIGSF